MVAAPTLNASLEVGGAERRFVLRGVPWSTYVALRDAPEDAGVRMTYLRGVLELMSPSERHEESKKLVARLLEAWSEEADVDLRAFGSTTFRSEAEERGLEPDECYTVGKKEKDAVPHIAIEVIVSSPLVDKLEAYAGLGVTEVWVWRESMNRLEIHRLVGRAYATRSRSEVLPTLDVELLSQFVKPGESHNALVKAYRAALALRSTPPAG